MNDEYEVNEVNEVPADDDDADGLMFCSTSASPGLLHSRLKSCVVKLHPWIQRVLPLIKHVL